jgi:hypothetical protein
MHAATAASSTRNVFIFHILIFLHMPRHLVSAAACLAGRAHSCHISKPHDAFDAGQHAAR